MNLNQASIEWAINHILKYGDSDLFPKPYEIEAISTLIPPVAAELSQVDISNYLPSPARRFLVPKEDLSYRAATQLDPLDSIFLTAIIHQFGASIEARRRLISEKRVFSYRFHPDADGNLYRQENSWNMFWQECKRKAFSYQLAIVLDISDFYNQIYHHTVENQIIESLLPNQAKKWIMNLLESLTAKTSRGIPVGPRAAHIIAEASMIPIDNSLVSKGVDYCRFVDDIIVFANTQTEAKKIIYEMASLLDKQGRLLLQRQKTKILSKADFLKYADEMVEDRPIDDFEKQLVDLIKRYSHGDPYRSISISQISNEDLKFFNREVIEKILLGYLNSAEPDYIRMRWLIRRLSQVGHPFALEFCLDNFERLIPAISEVCHYFISISNAPLTNWIDVGRKLFSLLDNEVVKSNEYFQLSILSLFNRRTELNHLDKLISIYPSASQFTRRESGGPG